MHYWYLSSPVGQLMLAGDENRLVTLSFDNGSRPPRPGADWQLSERPFRETIQQLNAYFEGQLRRFDLPLAPEGTAFQQEVWSALQAIPYGETLSYGQLARRIGRSSACRAVGAANGRNPIPIIIPCHRVIGANGSLTGFGGGLAIKHYLLELEGSLRHLSSILRLDLPSQDGEHPPVSGARSALDSRGLTRR
jgi:methylated-DNA-[protein]-cysteine S-methyltransferase